MKLSTKTYQKFRKPAFLFDRRAIASVLWAWPRGKVGVVKIFRSLRAQLLFLALPIRNVCIRH